MAQFTSLSDTSPWTRFFAVGFFFPSFGISFISVLSDTTAMTCFKDCLALLAEMVKATALRGAQVYPGAVKPTSL